MLGYGHGMHNFVLDEMELGTRTATAIDSENNCGWNAVNDLQYEEYVEKDSRRRVCPEPSDRWDY